MHQSFYGTQITLGIMQGRLSSKPNMPLQSFPENTWEEEFAAAAEIGFDSIEWLLDGGSGNALIKHGYGQDKIVNHIGKSNILIQSACAHSIINGEIFCSKTNQEIFLRNLIETLDHTSTIGCNQVVFPMMEKSSLVDNKKQQDFIAIILEILSSTQKSINLVIESELPAKDLLSIADKVNNSRFGVVVDVGNVTAQNLNVASEIILLSPILKEIHIKDREKNGGPTHRLGFGQTPFKDIVASLMQINWGGVMILETPIYDNWNEEAKINYMFTCKCIGLYKIIQ